MANEDGAGVLIDRELIDQIRKIEQATGRNDVLSGFVTKLEGTLKGFGASFSDHVARGDNAGAALVALSVDALKKA